MGRKRKIKDNAEIKMQTANINNLPDLMEQFPPLVPNFDENTMNKTEEIIIETTKVPLIKIIPKKVINKRKFSVAINYNNQKHTFESGEIREDLKDNEIEEFKKYPQYFDIV